MNQTLIPYTVYMPSNVLPMQLYATYECFNSFMPVIMKHYTVQCILYLIDGFRMYYEHMID